MVEVEVHARGVFVGLEGSDKQVKGGFGVKVVLLNFPLLELSVDEVLTRGLVSAGDLGGNADEPFCSIGLDFSLIGELPFV
jgi:hypothetical protein